MLKQKDLTLNASAASHRSFLSSIKQQLNAHNSIFSEITGVDFTHSEALRFAFGVLCFALALICMLDQVAAYGYSAFFAISSFNLLKSLILKF